MRLEPHSPMTFHRVGRLLGYGTVLGLLVALVMGRVL